MLSSPDKQVHIRLAEKSERDPRREEDEQRRAKEIPGERKDPWGGGFYFRPVRVKVFSKQNTRCRVVLQR